MKSTETIIKDVPDDQPRGWILLGSPHDGAILRDEIKDIGSTNWTTHKNAKIGDYAFFYITNPVKAIIASGVIVSQPILQNNPQQSWYKKYFSQVAELHEFPQAVTIKELKHLYPEWTYWQQPRVNCQVPETDIVQNFLQMIH